MKFSPLKFQASLAAGGVALMPFNYLQFTVPHKSGLVKLSDVSLYGNSILGNTLQASLVGVMFLFVLVHIVLTVIFLKELIGWLTDKGQYNEFINNSQGNIGIFSPIISLSMSMNVLWAPLGFFIPSEYFNIQGMMKPALIIFGIILAVHFILQIKVFKLWFTKSFEVEKLNFGWLLDVFALGMISLTGSGIASMAADKDVSSVAGFLTVFSLGIGFFLFIVKLAFLMYNQLKAHSLPASHVLPSFFAVLPITCLFGVSFYKFFAYTEKAFLVDVRILSYFVIVISFVATIVWGIFTTVLLKEYFSKEFIKSAFYPSQWSIVCGLVGMQVLGTYVYGNFYSNSVLSAVNFSTIFIAVFIYTLVLFKYIKADGSKAAVSAK